MQLQSYLIEKRYNQIQKTASREKDYSLPIALSLQKRIVSFYSLYFKLSYSLLSKKNFVNWTQTNVPITKDIPINNDSLGYELNDPNSLLPNLVIALLNNTINGINI